MRRRRMDRLYSDFVRQGDLVFDIGSHVGDRIGSFRRLGCRVVAVEPQPRLVRILRRFYGRDLDVAIEPMAIAAAPGSIELFVNLDNASLTTASSGFVAAASAAPGWHGERWPGRLVAPAITLDQLIERHGEPIFAKIDVEGFRGRGARRTFATARGILLRIHDDYAPGRDRLRDPLSGARRVPLQCRSGRKPTPGTSHRHRLEENAGAVSLRTSADTEDALLQEFAPGAASGLRYPESHLARLGI